MRGKRDSSAGTAASAGTPAKKKPRIAPTWYPEEKKPKARGARSEEMVIPVDEEEKSFPRGGQQKLTPLEKTIVRTQAKQDVIFDENEGTSSHQVDYSNLAREMEEDKKTMLKKKSKLKQKSKKLDILNLKKVVPGMLILGAVLEVHEYDVLLSLPFNMRGTVAISDVSDHVTKLVEVETERQEVEEGDNESFNDVPMMERLFVVGQLMPCYVQDVDGPRINLSVNPRLVNSHLSAKDIKEKLLLPGSIKSIEDHGYIIDFATENKTGFLLKKNAAEFVKNQRKGRSLCLGQIVHCLVLPGPDARTVPVTINPSKVCVTVMSSDHMIGIGSLLPGLLVNATVEEVAFNGLLMNFLDGFSGVVSPQHLPTQPGDDSLEGFQAKKKFKARLLWVDVAVKSVGLTLQREIVEGRSYEFEGVEIGDRFEAAKVTHVQFTSSLYLELGNGVVGYAPAWMITDEKLADAVPIKDRKNYRRGTLHDSRIVNFNRMDGVAIVSLQKSVLDRVYMRYSDINVGDIVDGVVEKIGTFGLIISVTESIRGLCPKLHVSDLRTIVAKPGKKYKQGSRVKCCVVNVNPLSKRLMLTCKKSFLRCSKEIPTEYLEAKPGAIYSGIVTSVRPYGCIVHFLGHVRGLVQKSELGTTSATSKVVSDPTLVFWEGQPVECRVMECHVTSEKLLLSFRLDPNEVGVVSDEDSLRPGSFVDGEVTGIASNGINLKYLLTGESMFLPTLHLSDYHHFCSFILAAHQTHLEKALRSSEPYILQDLMVVCDKLKFRPALVTMKTRMKNHMKSKGYINAVTDFKVGDILPGFIRNIVPYGCFVDFPYQLTGLAPIKFLTDEFISHPSHVYQETQTVWAKVHTLGEFEGRVMLTLRPSDLKSCDLDNEGTARTIMSSFETFISERTCILEDMKSRLDKSKKDISLVHSLSSLACDFVPGKRVTGHVTLISDDSVAIQLDGGTIGKSYKESSQGNTLEKGSEVVCFILDLDLVECCFILSPNPYLVTSPQSDSVDYPASSSGKTPPRGRTRRSESSSELGLCVGSSVVGIVEHKTPYYFIVSCSTLTGSKLAYGLMDTGQLGVLSMKFNSLRIRQQVTGTVMRSSDDVGGLPIIAVTGVPDKGIHRPLTGRPSLDPIPRIEEGDIISAVVQNIKPNQMNVKYRLWRGRVHCTLAKDPDDDDDIIATSSSQAPSSREMARKQLGVFGHVSAGDVVKARVVKIKEKLITGQGSRKGGSITVLELTTRLSLLNASVKLDTVSLLRKNFKEGDELNGVIWKVTEKGLHVHLTPRMEGLIPLLLVSRDIKVLKNLRKYYAEGQHVRGVVRDVRGVVKDEGKKQNCCKLSMIGAVGAPCEGDVIIGQFLQMVADHALTVATPFGNGRVDITDISDEYHDDPLTKIEKNRNLNNFCVVRTGDNKLDLSLRSSRVGITTTVADVEGVKDPEIRGLEDLVEGQVVRGYVKAVTDLGVFVRLGRNIDGRVQITHLTDGFVKKFKTLHSVGDLVRAKVIKVDRVKGKVDLSLRLSQVDPEAAKEQRKRQSKKLEKKSSKKKQVLNSDGDSPESVQDSGSDSDPSVNDDENGGAGEQEDDNVEDDNVDVTLRPTLGNIGGFQWEMQQHRTAPDGGAISNSDSSEDEDLDNMEVTSKKTRRQKKAAKKAEEIELYQKERSLLEVEGKEPESADDFDRLLLATPNSSALWVRYMAFYLHTTEVDKARNIAQRALRTISFREQHEKLNVWVALMNLENLFGSQDTLVKVFESSTQQNEPLEVYKRLTTIYEQSDKHDLANKLYQTMTRKFSDVQWVWSQYATFLMKQGRQGQARSLLQRALKSIVYKQEHVSMISRFSQLEFKYGEPERGTSMFESLLSTYPRRVDIWSVYIDMVLKTGDFQKVRDIFERAIHLKISAKKMKSIFKRYLEFEKQHGSQAHMDAVVEKARTFVKTCASHSLSTDQE